MITRRDFLGSAAALATTAAALPAINGAAFADSVDMLRLMAPQALPDIPLGSADAKVTIIEYASMTCPHCARFYANTFPDLKKRYIDTGKVKFIFREFPLDNLAAGAAVLARAGDPVNYYPLIELLFAQQTTWAMADDPVAALLKLAKQTGMTEEKFYAALKDPTILNNVLEVRKKAATDFGVNATPTFFINGEKAGGEMTIDEIAKIIDAKL